MSHRLIARSPDLRQLVNDGFDLEIRAGHLLVKQVPYVTAGRSVARGTLFMPLNMSGDFTAKPATHVAYWMGEHPHHSNGTKLTAFFNPSERQNFGDGLVADHTFSAKADYRDFHHKVSTYVGRIAGEARQVDANATPAVFPPYPMEIADSVFKYMNTAASRSGLGALNEKLANDRVAIVGLGGTGSYVLDLVAKSDVKEIHLFDGDSFLSHNAFRAPGATSLAELEARPKKATHWAERYSVFRYGITAHPVYLTRDNSHLLKGIDFVFLCLDQTEAKKDLIEVLHHLNIPFVEVGLGVVRNSESLSGLLRITVSTPSKHDHVTRRVPLGSGDNENEYSTNIQIAELNAFNAAMAVIQWKKMRGFYRDSSGAHYATYSIAANEMVQDDVA